MKLNGLQNTLNMLTFDEGGVLDLVEKIAYDTANDAQNRVKDSFVGSTITVERRVEDGSFVFNIGSDFELAGFLEWGTGNYVIVPPETTDAYTMQWYKNGKGTLRPAPFLIPAYRVGVIKLVNDLNAFFKARY